MKYFLLLLLFNPLVVSAQADSTKQQTLQTITFSGYIETYYSFDFNKPQDNNRPSFFYSHNRHNEFNINLAFLKASYLTNNIRANVSIAAGTYMNANYNSEPQTLKNLYEANAGVKLGKQNLWIDAGIFSSHIGFESAISKDCWNLTRSIVAENTPYFETGAKTTYITKDEKWLFSALVLNGWQRITRINGSSTLNLGTQIQYIPNKVTTINYSTFFGTVFPDSVQEIRYYHNFYGIFNVSKNFGVITGLDLGYQQISKRSSSYSYWYSPVLVLKYTTSPKFNLAGRIEYYRDKKGVIISTPAASGFSAMGFSFNLDYKPVPYALVRIELRKLKSQSPVFIKNNDFINTDSFLTTSLAISF